MNWNGPSDTNEPKGPPFTAGDDRLEVSAVGNVVENGGQRTFRVAGAFRVTLVP